MYLLQMYVQQQPMLLLEMRFWAAQCCAQWNTCTADPWIPGCISKTEWVCKTWSCVVACCRLRDGVLHSGKCRDPVIRSKSVKCYSAHKRSRSGFAEMVLPATALLWRVPLLLSEKHTCLRGRDGRSFAGFAGARPWIWSLFASGKLPSSSLKLCGFRMSGRANWAHCFQVEQKIEMPKCPTGVLRELQHDQAST